MTGSSRRGAAPTPDPADRATGPARTLLWFCALLLVTAALVDQSPRVLLARLIGEASGPSSEKKGAVATETPGAVVATVEAARDAVEARPGSTEGSGTGSGLGSGSTKEELTATTEASADGGVDQSDGGSAARPMAATSATVATPAPQRADAGTPSFVDPCRRGEGEGCTRAMDRFYAALRKTAAKRGQARVAHFGDSIVAYDNVSDRLRHRFQARFGDGGPGYLYVSRPSRSYLRLGLKIATSGWRTRSITGQHIADALYGLAGATFEATAGQKALVTVAADVRPAAGVEANRYEIHYLAQPGGGVLEALVDEAVAQRIDTGAEIRKSAKVRLELADGKHTLGLRPASGAVRVFGVVAEQHQRGVVYDSLGIVSGSARWLRLIDGEHWRDQLRQRAPDLAIFFFGTNEAGYTGTSAAAQRAYQSSYEQLLGRFRAALPDAACLVMAPLDAATLVDGELKTKPALPLIVESQRRAAAAQGCAFFDSFGWMGGKGSMIRWHGQGLAAADYTHPTRAGGSRVADAIFDTLMAEYERRGARAETPATAESR